MAEDTGNYAKTGQCQVMCVAIISCGGSGYCYEYKTIATIPAADTFPIKLKSPSSANL
ncbi:hypothetical protein HYX10_02925 [Candidatus Woesearchaeota archaeon]|nr:hypothetical protein [Candidatus Woesearchaeota archaeon]